MTSWPSSLLGSTWHSLQVWQASRGCSAKLEAGSLLRTYSCTPSRLLRPRTSVAKFTTTTNLVHPLVGSVTKLFLTKLYKKVPSKVKAGHCLTSLPKGHLGSHFVWLFFIFWPHREAFRISVSQPGIEPRPPAVKALSSNHGRVREVPNSFRFFFFFFKYLLIYLAVPGLSCGACCLHCSFQNL